MITKKQLPAAKSGSLKSTTVAIIREAICSGHFRQGQPLRELQLARELQVSQGTVRHALVELEHSGFVIRVPNRETIVTQFSPAEVRERLEIRLVLEVMAATAAMSNMQEAQFVELKRRAGKIKTYINRNDAIGVAQADMDFHRYLWEQSGSRTLCRLLEQLTAPIFAHAGLVRASARHSLASVVANHEALVSILQEGKSGGMIQPAFAIHIFGTPTMSAPGANGHWSTSLSIPY